MRPRTRYRFSASPEAPRHEALDEVPILRLARGPARKASDEVPILRLARGPTPRGLGRGRHIQPTRPTTPTTSAERRLDTAEWASRWESHRRHAVRDGTRQGLPAAVLVTMPMADTRAALCCLTPTPRTARRGKSSLGPCSLRINAQDQLLPLKPRLPALRSL